MTPIQTYWLDRHFQSSAFLSLLRPSIEENIETDKVSAEEKNALKQAIQEDEKVSEAVSALQVLGYSKREIVQALEKVDVMDLSVEDIIRKGLSNLAKGI